MKTMTEITDGVRAWAKGMYTTEAAVELLIRGGRIYPQAPWLIERPDGKVAVDFDELAAKSGPWSGGERALVAIAVSLVDEERPVRLGDEISSLDRAGVDLALAAIAHASGSHEHGGFRYDPETGAPIGTIRHETLYPWPPVA